MLREATLQQEGPVESIGLTRPFALVNLVGTVLIAILITASQASQIHVWSAAAGGIAVLALAALAHLRASSPYRAPVRRPSFVLVLVLLLIAIVLDDVARTGSGSVGGWAIAVVPLSLFVLSQVRPAWDMLAGGAALCLGMAGAAIALAAEGHGRASLLSLGLNAVVTAVPATLATAALVRITVRAMRLARLSVQGMHDEQEPLHTTQWDRDVVRLLHDVVQTDRVTGSTGSRAQVLATGLRARLVANEDRDWISELGITVTDEADYVDRMTIQQRLALRGLLAALPVTGPNDPGWARVSGQDLDALVEMELPLTRRPDSAHLGPAVLILRTVFPGARFRVEDSRARVAAEFSVR